MSGDKNIVEDPIAFYGQLDITKRYTYLDYIKWQFEDRVELIKGEIVKMASAPSRKHQKTSMNITRLFDSYFYRKSCQLYYAPFDVRLPIGQKDKPNTVVQPDLCVICDEDKLDDAGCNGVPDLVVEILSPSNTKYDLKTKFDVYEEVGVLEYWIVNPWDMTVIVYHLADKIYVGSKLYTEGEIIKSRLFPELEVEVAQVFEGIE